jgi:hypothetical protein
VCLLVKGRNEVVDCLEGDPWNASTAALPSGTRLTNGAGGCNGEQRWRCNGKRRMPADAEAEAEADARLRGI